MPYLTRILVAAEGAAPFVSSWGSFVAEHDDRAIKDLRLVANVLESDGAADLALAGFGGDSCTVHLSLLAPATLAEEAGGSTREPA
jgi:hypothetical protein